MSARIWQLERVRARFSGHKAAPRAIPSAAALAGALIEGAELRAALDPHEAHLRLAVDGPPCDAFAVARTIAGQSAEPVYLAAAADKLHSVAGPPLLTFCSEAAGAASAGELSKLLQRARNNMLTLVCESTSSSACGLPWALVGVGFMEAASHQQNDFAGLAGSEAVVPQWIVAVHPDATTMIVHAKLPAANAHQASLIAWSEEVVARIEALVAALGTTAVEGTCRKAPATQERESLAALVRPPQARWAARVHAALEALGRPDAALKKIVLAERFVVPHASTMQKRSGMAPLVARLFDGLDLLEHLGDQGGQTMRFAWPLATANAYFVGATPELLCEVDCGTLKTHAVAGTRAVEGDAQGAKQALLADDKERREHAFVIASLLKDLAPLCTGPLRLGETRAERFGRLLHLTTPVEGALRDDVDVCATLAALHPTPALGGHPRIEALRYLALSEPFVRGLYGAPLGWVAPSGDGALYVGIRSALIKEHESVLFAGAGIVLGSQPEREWMELLLKLAPMRRALALLGLG